MIRKQTAKRITQSSVTRREFIRDVSALTAAGNVLSGRATRSAVRSARLKKRPQLNLIYIGTDTWRADHLGCYGNVRVKTPHLDALARDGLVFTNVYADGLPTIPCRRVLYTGKSILPFSKFGSWQPLFDRDVTFAEAASRQGFTTGLIVDCYHFFAPKMNFHRGFLSWEWIRGQEFDRWRAGPKERFDTRDYLPQHLWGKGQNPSLLQYLLNTQDRRSEEDYFCARTCRAAMKWLERNIANKPFALWLEMFDPHEPWDAPKRFQEMYYDNYPCDRFLFGYGVDKSKLTSDDIEALKGLYAAEITFSDLWIGRLLDKVADLGLLDDTVIVFSTDHGTHLGEQGCVQKTPGLLNSLVAQVPLIMRHPDTAAYAGKRIDELVSIMDYMPTFLWLIGAQPRGRPDGKNFWPLVTGKTDRIHDELYTGFGSFAAIRTKQWHYFENLKTVGAPGAEPEAYDFRKATRAPDRGKGPCLYDLENDREESTNVVAEYPEVVEEMRRKCARRFGLIA